MKPMYIGTNRELFVDYKLLDKLDGTSLKLHEPTPMEISIKADRPGEGGGNFGGSVIHVNGQYIMYYRALDICDPEDLGKTAIAVSKDGIHWKKPTIQENGNAYSAGVNTGFVDTRPGVPESEYIKSFSTATKSGEPHTPFNDPGGTKYLVGFSASADGIHYTPMNLLPKLETDLFNVFDGGNSMFWSDAEQQYVFYFRYSILQPEDHGKFAMRRTVARSTSKDLVHWTEPIEMSYSDTPEEIYNNNTRPYFRAPHIYIALAPRFMERKRVLTQAQATHCGVLRDAYFEQKLDADNNEWLEDGYSNYNDCSDAVLLTTRAGSCVYDRTFMEGFVLPGPDYGNWATRCNYPLDGGFHQLDETTMSFYVNRHYCQNSWHVQRMSLRLDGFASLNAPWKGGTALTKPFIYDGNELELNYRTSAAGWIQVELTDEDGNLLPGFEANTCDLIVGDEIKRVVSWHSQYSLSRYVGKPVRLRFVMKDADIFSYKFNSV